MVGVWVVVVKLIFVYINDRCSLMECFLSHW